MRRWTLRLIALALVASVVLLNVAFGRPWPESVAEVGGLCAAVLADGSLMRPESLARIHGWRRKALWSAIPATAVALILVTGPVGRAAGIAILIGPVLDRRHSIQAWMAHNPRMRRLLRSAERLIGFNDVPADPEGKPR